MRPVVERLERIVVLGNEIDGDGEGETRVEAVVDGNVAERHVGQQVLSRVDHLQGVLEALHHAADDGLERDARRADPAGHEAEVDVVG